MTMQEKKMLARAVEMKKENWRVNMHFSENNDNLISSKMHNNDGNSFKIEAIIISESVWSLPHLFLITITLTKTCFSHSHID